MRPDGKKVEQIGISKYIRYVIDSYKEAVLPLESDDIGVLEYLVAKVAFKK